MSNEPLRMQILNMIERGDISAEEGLRWLEALAKNSSELPSPEGLTPEGLTPERLAPEGLATEGLATEGLAVNIPENSPDMAFPETQTTAADVVETPIPPASADQLPFDAARIRRYWVVPLWIGVGVTVIAGLLMYWANQAQGIGFWFACASVPLIFGLLLIILAVQSRTARWLYLRVEQPGSEWPRVIQFGFPLPLAIAARLLRFLRGRIPNMPDIDLDEMLSSLGRSATPQNPFYVQVEDDEDGEKVEIYIG